MVFDRNSSAYRSCCCHARTCTIVIGIVELIWLILSLIRSCITYSAQKSSGNGVARALEFDQIIFNFTNNFTSYGGSNTPVPVGSLVGSLVGSIFGTIIFFVAVVLLFVGVCKEDHRYLILHLVMQILGMIGLVVGIVIFALSATAIGVGAVVAGTAMKNDPNGQNAVFVGGLSLAVMAIIMCVVFCHCHPF